MMASRAEQKAQARAARLVREQEAAAAQTRRKRLSRLAGVVVIAVVVVAVVIAISSSGSGTVAATRPHGRAAVAAVSRVDALLTGIPQSGNVLGNRTAPITITEYGDLECSVCDQFALPTDVTASDGTPGSGIENEVIDNLVRTGKAKLAFDALDTATSDGATPGMFAIQQAAADDAGLQNKAWYYIELFYNEQGQEGTPYVTQSDLDGLAQQVTGLNYSQWLVHLHAPALISQVSADNKRGTQIDIAAGSSGASTPTVVVSGPKGSSTLAPGIPSYPEIQQGIRSVQ
jgi:protein-disulfide isomerase